MPTVSNTSPILNLAISDHLDLLRVQFAQVIIPPAVLDELQLETDFPGTESIRQALQSDWLRVVELQDVRVSRALALELDRGEAAAIALALELGGSHILMDEHEGRTKAKALGLQPIGVLGVLLRAKRNGSLDSWIRQHRPCATEPGFSLPTLSWHKCFRMQVSSNEQTW